MSLTLNSHSLNLNNFTESNTISNLSDYAGYSYDFFTEALSFVNKSNEEYRFCCREFYSSIHECSSLEAVNESFDTFKSKVKEIIKKFLAFINKLVERFITALNKFISSDKYLKKNETKFAYFREEDSFEMKKYVYTNIDNENFPNIHALTTFNTEYDKVVEIMDKVNAVNIKDKLAEFDSIYSNFIKDSMGSNDDFRSIVLNPNANSPQGAISLTDYDKEIFKIYRDGGDKQTVMVGPDTVTKSWVRFKEYANTIKVVKSNRDQLEREYKEIQNRLDKMISISNGSIVMKNNDIDHSYTVVSSEFTSKLELYIKAKIDQIVNMSNIHTLAISGKLTALTECYKADKALLYKALQKVEKVHESTEFPVNLNICEEVRDEVFDKLQETFNELEYRGFIIQEMYSQTEHSLFINETLLEGTGVSVLNEAGAIKNTITRIIQAIGKAYGKFMEFMSKLLKNDKKYLETYKDIILKKPPKDATIDGWFDYSDGLKRFVKLTYPDFNYETQKANLVDQNTWYKVVQGSTGVNLTGNPDIGVTGNIMNWLKGAERSIKANTLNMSDLYVYVYEFESKTQSAIKKDIDVINKASKNATTLVSSVQPETDTDNVKTESFISRYFNEADIKITDDSSSNTSKGSTGNGAVNPTATGSVGKVNQNISGKPEDDKAADELQNKNNDAMKADASKGGENQENVANAITLYFNTGKDVLTAKLNFATEVYNAYFKVIRWHVQQYNNKAGKESPDAVQKQTNDYSNGSKDTQAAIINTDGNYISANSTLDPNRDKVNGHIPQ